MRDSTMHGDERGRRMRPRMGEIGFTVNRQWLQHVGRCTGLDPKTDRKSARHLLADAKRPPKVCRRVLHRCKSAARNVVKGVASMQEGRRKCVEARSIDAGGATGMC